MTTVLKPSAYERALERAARGGVQIVLDYGNRWVVTSSNGVDVYEVCSPDEHTFTCTCPTNAKYLCKHIAKVQARLAEEQAAREQAMAAAMAEVAAREQQTRIVAQTWTVSLLLVAAAKGQALLAEQEAQWERYQLARMGGFAC